MHYFVLLKKFERLQSDVKKEKSDREREVMY